MQIKFKKYQGNGNDFVLVDNTSNLIKLSSKQINSICNRHFGIGADGFIEVLEKKDDFFRINYYNSNGNLSSLCGNGSRCAVQFVNQFLGKLEKKGTFESNQIVNQYQLLEDNLILIQLSCQSDLIIQKNHFIINTGSPHYIIFEDNIQEKEIIADSKKIRFSNEFPDGINVNWVEILGENKIFVRTYERGVEDETLSCGTGVTAAALAYAYLQNATNGKIEILSKGGKFEVAFERKGISFENVYLIGPAAFVFSGSIEI